ncbi:hypothetical protein SLS60_005865 [Paraconiothyrium brasiliense]|uniref:Protein kinase domain-containing protein n=1 Tax=Paraconiothyrium brasiliense TaxID=300254 RepID=A0ABR3RDE6_9PLEO
MRAMSIIAPSPDDEQLLNYILEGAKAIFATAVYIKLKPGTLREAMILFRLSRSRFRDSALPIKETSGEDLEKEADECFERLVKGLTDKEFKEKKEELSRKAITGVQHILRSIEGLVHNEEDRIWTDGRIIEFQENQKHFCAPIFQGTEVNHDLFNVTVPFIEKYVTRAEGSFGVVSKYRIHHDHIVSSNPPDGVPYEVVAVKELKPDNKKDAQEVSRHWAAEVRAMAMMNTLDHKGHIVRFVTAFRRGNRVLPEHYLITEWADGGNLEDLWKSMPKPQLTERTVQSIIRQLLGLAEAFNAAHNLKSGGVTTGASYRHGDLKPANILWFKPKPRDTHNVIGTLKICDWGEAKNKTFATVMRHSKTTADFGTRRYQPPEVDTGIHLSIHGESKRRSRLYDMWAMGCITLEIIVWLLYGYDGLEKFNASVRNELNDGAPFYQTRDIEGRRMAWVHNVVEHWMGHMANDAACRAGTTALGDLLEIVQRGLLKVKLPVAGGTFMEKIQPQPGAITQPQLRNLMRPPQATGPEKPGRPQHDTEGSNVITLNTSLDDLVVDSSPGSPVVNVISPDEDETDVQPKFLLPGPARYRADELRDGLLAITSDEDEYWCTESNTDLPTIPSSLYARGPTHSVLRRLQGQEVDYGKTSIETERWTFKSDNDFASRVFSKVQSNDDFPVPSVCKTEDLCHTCQILRDGIWSPVFTIKYIIKELEARAQGKSCALCGLLWKTCEVYLGKWRGLFSEVGFERFESTLTMNGDNKMPVLSICRTLEESRKTADFQVGFAELPAPESETSLEVVRQWLADCDDNHADCKPSKSTSSSAEGNIIKWPTRLLEVGEGQESTVYLRETAETTLQGKGEWIALSHRWGEKPHFCTTTNNRVKFKSGIPIQDLPDTFKHAVAVTRALGCRYLWIDSICIVQEGPDADFKEEAKYMEEVYSGARCVIAASRANGHKDGFLKSRNKRGYVGLQREQEDNAPFYICEMIDNFEEHILGGSLNKRGWVLQEHALARRTIFFDEHQTYWECGQGVRCETMTKLDNEAAKLLGDPNFPEILDSAKQAERIIRFEELYQQYSRLGLSKQYDRPTALAGLEQRLHRTMKVKGRFGMFDDLKAPGLLRRSLLWHRGKDIERLTRVEFLPTQTPAPSWSWMAWTGTKIDDYKYTPGGINYFQVPFQEFDWEDVQTPWTQQDLDEENALSVDARAYDCTSAQKEQYTFIGDLQKGSAPKRGMCVVLGVQVGSLKAVDKQHYLLLIDNNGKMDRSGVQRWERIGAGWVFGKFLENDVTRVKVY